MISACRGGSAVIKFLSTRCSQSGITDTIRCTFPGFRLDQGYTLPFFTKGMFPTNSFALATSLTCRDLEWRTQVSSTRKSNVSTWDKIILYKISSNQLSLNKPALIIYQKIKKKIFYHLVNTMSILLHILFFQ